jgi:cytochrome c oxidase assembly protein subunit 15
MFSFPMSGMVGGIFYEHGHRLIASTVGFMTIGLVVLLSYVEPRRWVRRLGWLALAAVVLQGALGGLTVIYLLPDAISISHAGLAQIFFGLTVSIALFTSRTWRQPPDPPVDDARLRQRMLNVTVLIYLQILIGATMRHTGAGLAIPDFPLSYGRILPPFWNAQIAVHFLHRIGAVAIVAVVLATLWTLRRQHARRRELMRPAWLLAAAVAVQVTLGALVVLTGKQPIINTLHVATGATVLGTSLFLTLRTYRVRFERLVTRNEARSGLVRQAR